MFYTDLIYLLLGVVLFSGWPVERPYLGLSEILLGWTIKEFLFIGIASLYLRQADSSSKFIQYQSRLKILAFIFFALDVSVLEIPSLFQVALPQTLSFLKDFFGILLFLQYFIILWGISAIYERRTPLINISITKYVLAHLRLLSPFLIAWFILILCLQGISSLIGNQHFLSEWPLLEIGYMIIFILTLIIMVPPILVRIWQCLPLPEEHLRQVIRQYLLQEDVKVKEILVWRAFEGRLLTAGVIGIFQSFRYLLLTSGLLAILEEPEILSVVAHEVGHLKHRHLWWLLFFFLGFILLTYFSFPTIYLVFLAYFPKPELLGSFPKIGYFPDIIFCIFLLLFVIIYFRLIFGVYIRHFERQADIYCLESLGTAEGLIRSLQKIALLSGHTEHLPSWHHYSIAERIDFLRAATTNPKLIEKHHRQVKYFLGIYLFIVLILIVFFLVLPKQKLETKASFNLVKANLAAQGINLPKAEIFNLVGDIALKKGKEKEAIRYYEKALSLDPENTKALNNIAWILVTAKDKSLRNPEKAIALAEKAVRKKSLAVYLDTLAEAWFAVGNPKKACLYARLAWSRIKHDITYPDRDYYKRQLERFCNAAR